MLDSYGGDGEQSYRNNYGANNRFSVITCYLVCCFVSDEKYLGILNILVHVIKDECDYDDM